MAIGLGDNIGITGPLPTDNRYFSTLTNKPWTGCTDVTDNLAGGVGGVRYTGLTVNIAGTEYWFKDGIDDGDLIEKTSGGGTTISGTTAYLPMFTTGETNVENSHLYETCSCVGRYLQTNICALGSCNPNEDFAWNFGNDCTCYLHLCYGTGSWSGPRLSADSHTLSLGGSFACIGVDNCIIINVSGSANNNLTIKGGTTCNNKSVYCLAGDDNEGDYGISVGIQGGDACPSFNADGGDVILTPGLKAGTGDDGRIILDGLPACTTETNVLYVDANGALSSGATSSTATDLSIGSSTGTVVRIDSSTGTNATLPLASATVAGVVSNGTQTFAGTKTTTVWCGSTSVDTPLVNATGNIVFTNTGTRTICVAPAVGVGQNVTIIGGLGSSGSNYGGSVVMCGALGGATSTTPGAGGNAALLAGQGGTNTAITNGGVGGRAIVRAGQGGDSNAGEGGVGGQAELCAGNGYNAASYGDGGNVKIQSGCGASAGCVQIYHGATSRMNSTTTGMYTNGVHCASTCLRAPWIISTGGACVTGTLYSGSAGKAVCDTGGYLCIGGASGVQLWASTYRNFYTSISTAYLAYNGSTKLVTTTAGITVTGAGTATDWVSTSDCRLKECIEPITSALSTVDALCGVYYQLCADETGERKIGLIAQDVEKVLPAVISHIPNQENEEGSLEEPSKYDDLLGIRYNKLTALLIEAVKELKTQNECLQIQINELRNN